MGYTTFDRLPDSGSSRDQPRERFFEHRSECWSENEHDDQLLEEQGHDLKAYWDLQYRRASFYGQLTLTQIRSLSQDEDLCEHHQALYHRVAETLDEILALRAFYFWALQSDQGEEDAPEPPFSDRDDPLPPEAALIAAVFRLTSSDERSSVHFQVTSSGASSRNVETSFDDALNNEGWNLSGTDWLSLAAEHVVADLLSTLEEEFIRDLNAEHDRCWDDEAALEDSLEEDLLFSADGDHVHLSDLSARQQRRGEKKLGKAKAALRLRAREEHLRAAALTARTQATSALATSALATSALAATNTGLTPSASIPDLAV